MRQQFNLAFYRWNPAWTVYAGAAGLYLLVYWLSGGWPPAWLTLLSIFIGGCIGFGCRIWWAARVQKLSSTGKTSTPSERK